MKRALFTFILFYLIGISASLAQVEKGKLFFSGAATIDLKAGGNKKVYPNSDDVKNSYCNFKLYDQAGYTVIDNLPVGIFVNLNTESFKNKTSDAKNSTLDFAIGPFVRYYIHNFNDLMPYVEGMVGGGVSNSKFKSGVGDVTKNNAGFFTYRVGGGATYFLTDALGFDLFMGFNHDAYKKKDTSSERAIGSENKDIYNTFNLTLGIVVLIDK